MADIPSARMGETNAKDREIECNMHLHMSSVASLKQRRLSNFCFHSTVLRRRLCRTSLS